MLCIPEEKLYEVLYSTEVILMKNPAQGLSPWAGKCLCVIVVCATLSNEKLAIFDSVNQAIFFIDSAAEEPLEVSLQSLRVADSLHGAISVDVFHKGIDALESLFVLCLPVQVVFPSFI